MNIYHSYNKTQPNWYCVFHATYTICVIIYVIQRIFQDDSSAGDNENPFLPSSGLMRTKVQYVYRYISTDHLLRVPCLDKFSKSHDTSKYKRKLFWPANRIPTYQYRNKYQRTWDQWGTTHLHNSSFVCRLWICKHICRNLITGKTIKIMLHT